MKDQVVKDFIVGHNIDQNSDEPCNPVSIRPWKLFFDGLVCREGQGVGGVLTSPRGAVFKASARLEYFYTNNQGEYEAIFLGLQILSSMGVKYVEAFSDLLLVVQQIAGTFQCFDGSLNTYLGKCLEIIALYDDFTVQHVFKDENTVTNELVQQALGFLLNWGKFYVLEKPDVPVCQIGCFNFWPMQSAWIYSGEPSSAKTDGPVSEIRGFRISSSLDNFGETTTAKPDDWRTPWYII
jgi:ribonuclease HI